MSLLNFHSCLYQSTIYITLYNLKPIENRTSKIENLFNVTPYFSFLVFAISPLKSSSFGYVDIQTLYIRIYIHCTYTYIGCIWHPLEISLKTHIANLRTNGYYNLPLTSILKNLHKSLFLVLKIAHNSLFSVFNFWCNSLFSILKIFLYLYYLKIGARRRTSPEFIEGSRPISFKICEPVPMNVGNLWFRLFLTSQTVDYTMKRNGYYE